MIVSTSGSRGTVRSFDPLPRTPITRSPSGPSIERRVSPSSSDNRRPQVSRVTMTAKSRSGHGSRAPGRPWAATRSRRSTLSSPTMAFGRLLGTRGLSMAAIGLPLTICSPTMKAKS